MVHPPRLDPKLRPRVADILKALGHPLRLHIVELLAAGESCVGPLQEETGATQSAVSQHMSILRHAGVVDVRRDGTRRMYTLANPHLVSLLHCLASCQQRCSHE